MKGDSCVERVRELSWRSGGSIWKVNWNTLSKMIPREVDKGELFFVGGVRVRVRVNTLKWEDLEWFDFFVWCDGWRWFTFMMNFVFLGACSNKVLVATRCWRRGPKGGPKAEWFKWIDHYFWTHSFPLRQCYNTPTLGWWWNTLPSLKLTWHLKIGHPKRKLVFQLQPSIFRFYVSFREGNLSLFFGKSHIYLEV